MKEVFARSVHPEDNSFQICFDQFLGCGAVPLPLLHLVKAILLSAGKESHFKSEKNPSTNPGFYMLRIT